MTALPWGGSEVLWAATAKKLLEEGHEVFINFQYWEPSCNALQDLESRGAQLQLRRKPLTSRQIRGQRIRSRLKMPLRLSEDQRWLSEVQPDFIVITCGYHLDWLPELDQIMASGIPFAINLQVADTNAVVDDALWHKLRELYKKANVRFFLSEENRRIMERLLVQSMAPSHIVDNPTKVPFKQPPIPFPDIQQKALRLACIARVQFASKGHDLLVEALRDRKWKDRNLKITIFGEDQGNTDQLKARIQAYGIEDKFEFAGYQADPEAIWSQHVGLVLFSRFEGLPMVTIEAMRMGRVVIVTACGRNSELISDGETGFLARSASPEAVTETLERAWSKREQWKSMGLEANRQISQRYGEEPIEAFKALVSRYIQH